MKKSHKDGNLIALVNYQIIIKEGSLHCTSGSEDTPFEIWVSYGSQVEN